jgi:hypothetical protein
MTPDEMQALLQAHNIGFTTKEIPYGRQFRLADGAIANVYEKGKISWQGKDTETVLRFNAIAVLALQVIEDFFGDVGVRVYCVLGAILDDEPQPLIAYVEDVGQCLEVSRLEDLFGFIALQGPRAHLQLRVQVGHDLTEEVV